MTSNKLLSILIVFFIVNTLFVNNAYSSGEIVLKETQGWVIDSIAPGLIRYTYAAYNRQQFANQIVNVLEVDYTDPSYNMEVKFVTPADSLSSVAKKAGAIAGINGSYELDATFVKTNNTINSQISLQPGHLRFWKHEGAFFYNGTEKSAAIEYGTNNGYFSSSYPNILSGAPMLVDNFSPVGETFIGDVTGINLNALEYEDYRRHQGVRHPRTAIARTEGNKLLLIVVDGRRSGVAEGMTAKELTQFIVRYFNPKEALNIDGGGSSTMYIKGSSESTTGVVNYPTDNDKFDHYGQRSVRTFILVKQVGESSGTFGGGSGTAMDPYLISTVAHMQSMHTANYANPLYFRLTADIDMKGVNWQPLNPTTPYDRHIHFDGNGHVIKNLKVEATAYGSLFGVVCGSVRNLGVINADIESTSGGGIIGGYAGLKGPGAPTGMIANCYTTGKVSGTDAVGGIVGNVGKPNGDEVSGVINCYSTADVTATNTTGNSRAGGIAGIVFEKGMLKNCYSTGKVTSSFAGAGGIVGWSDSSIEGVVSMNSRVVNTTSGNLGRISAFMGAVNGMQAQGINCWGYDGVVLDDAGTILTEGDLQQGTITIKNAPYDGVSKTREFLSDPMNYFMDLGWDFASDNNVWAQTMHNGYPIFQWMYERGDYAAISGLSGGETGLTQSSTNDLKISITGTTVEVFGANISAVKVYDISGKTVYNDMETTFELSAKGIYLVTVISDSKVITKKIIIK